jgi:cbb3-type cytochrome oxidase subunit 3
MSEIWAWLGDLGNSKVLALLIFFTTFVGIVLYVYTGKQRKERLESYKNIPFLDDEDNKPASKQGD